VVLNPTSAGSLVASSGVRQHTPAFDGIGDVPSEIVIIERIG
jgi:hypothetical protein